MVSSLDQLVSTLKPLVTTWAPSDAVEAVEAIIKSWADNKFGTDELTDCETRLQAAFGSDCTEDIEQRLDTLFGAFDGKAPSAMFRNQVLGKLDRAGGSLLDSTQYTENDDITE